jgi:hypothetical protein
MASQCLVLFGEPTQEITDASRSRKLPDAPTRAIILDYSHFSHTARTVRLRLKRVTRFCQHVVSSSWLALLTTQVLTSTSLGQPPPPSCRIRETNTPFDGRL